MKILTAADVKEALAEAVPSNLTFSVECSDDTVSFTLLPQSGIPWELQFGWEGVPGEGEHLFGIFSDLLKYEEWSLEAIDRAALDRFKRFVGDLLNGTLTVELTRFRKSGKLWRTQLVDPRRPEGEQVVYRYYRSVLRWGRPVITENVRLGGPGASP